MHENSESFSRNLKSSGTGWTTTEVVPTEPANSVNNPSIVVDGVGNVTFLFQSSK